MNVDQIRKNFKWFSNNKNLVYFDNGATSLKPDCVIEAMNNYYEKLSSSSHNDDSFFTHQTNLDIIMIRKKVAKFLDCNDDEIIFTSGATEALNLFAFGLFDYLKNNDEILIPEFEHASNLLPWLVLAKRKNAKVKIVKENAQMQWENNLLKMVNKKTKIVSFASASNLFGTAVNFNLLAKKIKKINPKVIIAVDATQSIQHQKINLRNSTIDLLCFSSHKLFGPTGSGVAYIKKAIQSILLPYKFGGSMYKDFDPETLEIEYLNNSGKYEGGTPNIAAIYGLGAAIDFVNNIGFNVIIRLEKELLDYLVASLKKIANVQLLKVDNKIPVVAFNIKDVSPQDVAYYLGRHNIIVRSGVSCANLVSHYSKTKQGFIRASLMFYNKKQEIDFLIKTLKNFKVGDSLDGLI